MFKRLLFIGSVLIAVLGLAVNTVSANPPPLPSLPNAAVIENVRIASAGGTFTPLGAPTFVMNRLATFTGVFAGVQNLVSTPQAVHYLDLNNGRLRESLLPLIDSRTAQLDPTFTTPGSNSRQGKIIGAIFQPGRGNQRSVMVVVAVFKPGEPQNAPEKVRFYYNSSQYFEYSLYHAFFLDSNGNQMVEVGDEGAVISHKLSCVTVGLEQVCWDPYDYSKTRDGSRPKDIAYDAYTRAKNTYDLSVDFYVDDAVPDMLGYAQRQYCASQMLNAMNFGAINGCVATAVISAAKESQAGQPFALIVALQDLDLSTYDLSGNFLGTLPAGEYLAIEATPYVTNPGEMAVTFLVNINSYSHYLLPGIRMQGFGENGVFDSRQAGIKDGFAGYVGWGC